MFISIIFGWTKTLTFHCTFAIINAFSPKVRKEPGSLKIFHISNAPTYSVGKNKNQMNYLYEKSFSKIHFLYRISFQLLASSYALSLIILKLFPEGVLGGRESDKS